MDIGKQDRYHVISERLILLCRLSTGKIIPFKEQPVPFVHFQDLPLLTLKFLNLLLKLLVLTGKPGDAQEKLIL